MELERRVAQEIYIEFDVTKPRRLLREKVGQAQVVESSGITWWETWALLWVLNRGVTWLLRGKDTGSRETVFVASVLGRDDECRDPRVKLALPGWNIIKAMCLP